MKPVFIFFLLLCVIGINCTAVNKIYVVRHAEKGTEPANNQHLTEVGVKRAQALKDLLIDKKIVKIFSTNTNRAVETAYPLSKAINVEMQYYAMDTVQAFLQRLVNAKTNTLVIGHSNTILPMFDKLGLHHNLTSIGDFDYNNLFIINIKNGKAIKLEETTYGAVNIKN